jgi:hypothetical protein
MPADVKAAVGRATAERRRQARHNPKARIAERPPTAAERYAATAICINIYRSGNCVCRVTTDRPPCAVMMLALRAAVAALRSYDEAPTVQGP